MRKRFKLWSGLAGLLLLTVALGGCLDGIPLAGVDYDSGQLPSYGLVTPQEAATVILSMEDNSNFVLLDIRTPAEVEAGHISGAVNLDLYSPTFEQSLEALDRDKTYLIYCRSGNRTGQARTMMTGMGFSKVYDLDGGINEWNNLSHPICLGALDAEHDCSGEYPTP
jgi:rhodanese-related sulfurtransferase